MPEMKKRGYNSVRVAHLLALAYKQDGELQVELTTGAKHKILPNGASGSPDYCLSTKGVVAFSTIVGHQIISTKTDTFRLDSADLLTTGITAFHIDSFPLKNWELDNVGNLRWIAPIAREGYMDYLDDSGRIYQEYVPESTLVNSLDSFKTKAVTLHHPSVKVTPENSMQYQRGLTGYTGFYDGKFLWLTGTATDKALIDSIRLGKTKEISPGYEALLKRDSSRIFQAARDGNHVAFVGRARGGSGVSLRMDSALIVRSSIAESELPDIPKEILTRWV